MGTIVDTSKSMLLDILIYLEQDEGRHPTSCQSKRISQ